MHYQNLYEKIKRNLNEGKSGLGKRYFSIMRTKNVFVRLVISGSLEMIFKIGVLKNSQDSHKNTCVGASF